MAASTCCSRPNRPVACSWICGYFAIKHLPVSLASPIRATGPVWTLVGALLVLGERPSWLEMLGIVITLASFVLLSFAGAREGVHFHRDKWVGWLIAGTLLGACSGLYDKFLMARAGFAASTVQAWFSIYLALFFSRSRSAGTPLVDPPRVPLALECNWRVRGSAHRRFRVLQRLRDPAALISLVSSLRRASTLVAFAGACFFSVRSTAAKNFPPS